VNIAERAPDAMLPLVVCADDFGLSAAVNSRVLTLAAAGAISATSCLVGAPACNGDAMRKLLATGVDVGIHLNFTEGRPLSEGLRRRWDRFPSLPVLIARAHAGLLPLGEVIEECAAQCARFSELAGHEPCFLDGHQHVHHLPGIRSAWLPILRSRAPTAYVRSTAELPGPGFGFKRWAIRWTGGLALAQVLRASGINAVSPLIGTYDFEADDYRSMVRQWLHGARERQGVAVLYCHPGQCADPEIPSDPIGAAREREWQYLSSEAWPSDLADVGFRIVRGSEVFSMGAPAHAARAGVIY
jgi:predicted glycoside hydrolase/deacetylase ChbG (UPF0249 family)